MKISPVAAGAVPSANPEGGSSVSADRVARAIAVAEGKPAEAQSAPAQEAREQTSVRKIKMRTQRSTDRHLTLEPQAEPVVDAVAPSDTTATTEQTEGASEATKPLSPQFAALARAKRALQLEKQDIAQQRQAMESKLVDYIPKDDIKSNALKVMLDNGVTYDQLTEQILASNQESSDLSALKADIQALKDGLENQTKSISERDQQAETQVLAQIGREVDQLIAQGDDFETIREAGYGPKVVELIHKTWQKSGELLDITEAANLVEKEALSDALKWARLKKVQSQLNPAPPVKQQPVQQDRPGTKIMRTLTNRDGASSTTMSKRERAIAAMEGRLNK